MKGSEIGEIVFSLFFIVLLWVLAYIPHLVFYYNPKRRNWIDAIGYIICIGFTFYTGKEFFFDREGNYDFLTWCFGALPYFILLIKNIKFRINNYRKRKFQEEQEFFNN